jgi:succinate dehydrogenase/fumarate reductase flavoprotein subunit
MNSPAIDIYREHDIDLNSEPLEIAVCAQHNNGGFAINKWWESNIKHTFVIGEMAGSHGVKRPGGSALNAGQVGAQRAAEFIVNAYSNEVKSQNNIKEIQYRLESIIEKLNKLNGTDSSLTAKDVIKQIQNRMTVYGGHIRKPENAEYAIKEAIELYNKINNEGLMPENEKDIISAVQVQHLSLASIGYLKAIAELLKAGGGSRGSHLILTEDGAEVHPDIKDPDTGDSLNFKPENEELRKTILRIKMDENSDDMFSCETIPVRQAPKDRKAFELTWTDYREGKIY